MFQSTPPVWRAAIIEWGMVHLLGFQSTPPCGGRQQPQRDKGAVCPVSIHAPRVEGGLKAEARAARAVFQSTPPVWRAAGSEISAGGRRQAFQSTPPVWRAAHRIR